MMARSSEMVLNLDTQAEPRGELSEGLNKGPPLFSFNWLRSSLAWESLSASHWFPWAARVENYYKNPTLQPHLLLKKKGTIQLC